MDRCYLKYMVWLYNTACHFHLLIKTHHYHHHVLRSDARSAPKYATFVQICTRICRVHKNYTCRQKLQNKVQKLRNNWLLAMQKLHRIVRNCNHMFTYDPYSQTLAIKYYADSTVRTCAFWILHVTIPISLCRTCT